MNNLNMSLGDCLDVMRTIPSHSIDSIVTDPPYGISFMNKGWDACIPSVEVWIECLRILKPGGYLLAFAGTRTQHRMCCNIEDAGFEIRDMIAWVYGSGFPKSLDVSKAIDRAAGKLAPEGQGFTVAGYSHNPDKLLHTAPSRGYVPPLPATPEAEQWKGWGTALKPALEPITVARKPLVGTVAANVLEHGTGALNIDGCRVEGTPAPTRFDPAKHGHEGWRMNATGAECAANASPLGRWPANLIHDGSDEVLSAFPESAGQQGPARTTGENSGNAVYSNLKNLTKNPAPRNDSGSAARFFYCAKASKSERGSGNNHPTVKPVKLMRYLCKLVTPPAGVIVDPFAGSGTTGVACAIEGFSFIGIDNNAQYVNIANLRILSTIKPYTDGNVR